MRLLRIVRRGNDTLDRLDQCRARGHWRARLVRRDGCDSAATKGVALLSLEEANCDSLRCSGSA